MKYKPTEEILTLAEAAIGTFAKEQPTPVHPDVQTEQSGAPCQLRGHSQRPVNLLHMPTPLHGLLDPPGQTSSQEMFQ